MNTHLLPLIPLIAITSLCCTHPKAVQSWTATGFSEWQASHITIDLAQAAPPPPVSLPNPGKGNCGGSGTSCAGGGAGWRV